MNQDEKEWQDEFGILPAETERFSTVITSTAKMRHAEPKVSGKLINLTEFSGYLADNNLADNNLANFSNMSLGQYFGKRCGDVREMIPSRSPTKHKPIALLGDSYRTGSDYSSSGDSKKYSKGKYICVDRNMPKPMTFHLIQLSLLLFCSVLIILHRR